MFKVKQEETVDVRHADDHETVYLLSSSLFLHIVRFTLQPSTYKKADVAKGKSFRCGKCEVTFVTKAEYNRHRRSGRPSGRHVCSTCGKKFGKQSHLSAHENADHRRLKPFVCSFCDKCFGKQGHADRHERAVHLRERSFTCSYCDKMFSSRQYAETHERTVHMKQKNFECVPCKKRFAQSGDLQQHNLRFHSDNPPTFTCSYCDKTFTHRSNRLRHERKKHSSTTNVAT